MGDVSKYVNKYGSLTEQYCIPVDADTKQMIDAIKRSGVNLNAFSRDLLIPKLQEIYKELKPGAA